MHVFELKFRFYTRAITNLQAKFLRKLQMILWIIKYSGLTFNERDFKRADVDILDLTKVSFVLFS